MIGMDGEKELGKSVLSVWLDDDDIYIYIHISYHTYLFLTAWLYELKTRTFSQKESNFITITFIFSDV